MIQKFEGLDILECFFPNSAASEDPEEKNIPKCRGLQIFESFETKIGLEWTDEEVKAVQDSIEEMRIDVLDYAHLLGFMAAKAGVVRKVSHVAAPVIIPVLQDFADEFKATVSQDDESNYCINSREDRDRERLVILMRRSDVVD